METLAIQTPSGSSVAASYPRWVMLQRKVDEYYSRSTNVDLCSSDDDYGSNDGEDSCSTADAKTLATARTTNGHLVGVSFRFAAPPASSRVWVQIPDGVQMKYSFVLAAHGDSVLIEIALEKERLGHDDLNNYFIYNAGTVTAKPPRSPSLLLLPSYFLTEEEKTGMFSRPPRGPVQRTLGLDATGLLRRGEDELVVAELKIVAVGEDTRKQKAPELFMLRSGEWSVKQPLIRHSNGGVRMLVPSSWRTDTVFPVDDRLLCWVDSSHGIVFCDVFEESPGLRYVPLPADPCFFNRRLYRNVCVTAGSAVKFVNIFPRCCCGAAGATYCHRSNNAYTVRSWTLRMDDMSWVMDAMVDSTELWSLDAYKGLPRIKLAYPVLTLDEPHVICFMLCEDFHVNYGDETQWLITVDTRSKTIPSVCLHHGGRQKTLMENLIPSKVSDYFNSYPNCSNGGTSLSRKGHMDSVPPVNVVDEIRTDDVGSSVQSSCKTCAEPAMQVSAFLTAFQEIPTYGLARDDMLKAYSILSDDNCRRFKSLLGLPMNLRKDWLLIEIKASED